MGQSFYGENALYASVKNYVILKRHFSNILMLSYCGELSVKKFIVSTSRLAGTDRIVFLECDYDAVLKDFRSVNNRFLFAGF